MVKKISILVLVIMITACSQKGMLSFPCLDNGTCIGLNSVCDTKSDLCVFCGVNNQRCCSNNTCDSPNICLNGLCKVCGSSGGPCCPGEICSPEPD